jgi:cytochrome b6-f complex iron-sulfur subunit
MATRRVAEGEAVLTPQEMSRREFLNYAWGASILLFMAEMGIVTYLFALPRFRAGQFGGAFTLNAVVVPPTGAAPVDNPDGKFWISHTDQGVKALYKVCTHLGCLFKWVDTNNRFECPCHGSKFQLDGTYIEGPAPRSLDQFPVEALDAEDNVLAQSDGKAPLQLPEGTAKIQVDTGNRIKGQPS